MQAPPFQFRLKTLLICVAGVAVFCWVCSRLYMAARDFDPGKAGQDFQEAARLTRQQRLGAPLGGPPLPAPKKSATSDTGDGHSE